MKTTKAVVSVHLESEIPKPSTKGEKKRLKDLKNPLEELVQDRQSSSEGQHPFVPITGCPIALLERVDDAQAALEIFPHAEFDFSLVSGGG